MSEKSSSTAAVGLPGLVFIVFLFLKLAEIGIVKDWSWWLVTSPLWIPACIVAIAGIIALIFLIIGFITSKKECDN